ncbi:unnamed protein product [Dibothriocephalus latus]|uniref:Uncharacterized protein n=1 Tax=Dibothriocephalus latus TaxID=60516 RepID=A0A3P6QDK6_DIBLA|nr:unnamed protein product [Dibothriocephalus latus]
MKSDLRDNTEAGKKAPVLVSEAEGKATASSIGAFAYIECSGKYRVRKHTFMPLKIVDVIMFDLGCYVETQ